MRNPRRPEKPTGIIILRQTAKHEWSFCLPRIGEEVHERLEEGIDRIGTHPRRAAAIFRELLEEYPEHLDAYHHLALTLDKMGKRDEAFRTWESAVKLALNSGGLRARLGRHLRAVPED